MQKRLLFSDQTGQSLVLALVIMSALTITVGALISYTTGNESSFGRDRQSNRAYNAAEAGLNDALAVITKLDTNNTYPAPVAPTTPAFSYNIPSSFEGATGTYTGTKWAPGQNSPCTPPQGQSNNPCWVITSTAISSDNQVTRSVSQTVYWNSTVTDLSGVYDYGLFVNNTGPGAGCVTLHGGANFHLSIRNVWIGGCLSMLGGAHLLPVQNHDGSVYIGGQFQPNGNSTIGDPSNWYSQADIQGGCTSGTCSDYTHSGVYADTYPSASTTLQKPPINAGAVYTYGTSSGQPGDPTVLTWQNVCTPAGSFTLDTNGSPDRSVPTTMLMPTADTTCRVFDTSGNLVGSLIRKVPASCAPVPSPCPPVTDVQGTIFIDGDVNLSTSGYWTGNGTIYVNGIVTGGSNIQVCGPGPAGSWNLDHGCAYTKWDSTVGKLLFVVVNPLNNPAAFTLHGQGEVDLGIFANAGYTDTGGIVVAGSIIADQADIGGSAGVVAPSGPANGAPTTLRTTSGWTLQPGSWKQTK